MKLFGTRSASTPSAQSRGDRARDSRMWNEAVLAYQEHLTGRPGDGPIWVQLGNCLKEAERFDEALAAYDRALTLMPDDADLHIQRGHLAKLDRRRSDAIACFTAALEIDPERRDVVDELQRLGVVQPRYGAREAERDRALNRQEAALEPEPVARSAAALGSLVDRLPTPDPQDDPDLIPRMLHFVFGFKQKGDLPYYACMAIRSALHFNPGWKAYYYTMHEPEGPNWDRVKDHVSVILIDDFTHFRDARFHHYAHKADVVRMIVLNRVGGAYLDVDSITQRSFEDLRRHEYVMGVQAAGPDSSSGLCNAIMFGKPGARFSSRWLEQYDYFRSKGRDDLWDFHSVKLPVSLAAEHPEEITVLDYRALFYPLWGNIRHAMFSEMSGVYAQDFTCAYAYHLWNGATGSWLDEVDLEFVRSSRSIYAMIARQVEGLPEPDTCPAQ